MSKFLPAAILLKIFCCSPLFAALNRVDKINDSTALQRVRPSNKRVADMFAQGWAHFSIFLAFMVWSSVGSAGTMSLTYATVDEMLQDNSVGYSDLSPGDIIQVGAWNYEVAAPTVGDEHLTTDNGVGLYALPGSDGALHTSQFGWQSGDDISQEFTHLMETSLGVNSHIIFDDLYSFISGAKIDLPDGLVLEGAQGSGLNVTGITQTGTTLFNIGSDTKILDMNFVAEGSGALYQNYRLFEARDEDNILISGSHFQGNIGIFVDLHGGSNFVSEDNVFQGGVTQMRWLGYTQDYTVDNTAFIESSGDGIKTVAGTSGGTVRATISNSLFAENTLDGIDTTGGFKDSTVSNSIFVGNGVSGMDIKTGIHDNPNFNVDLMNENILITGSQFIDNQNGIVFTTLDGNVNPVDAATASQWSVQNVHIQDAIFENNYSGKNAFLIKDAHDISWDNIQLLGNIGEFRLVSAYDWNMPYAIGGTGVTTDVARGDFDWQALLDTFGPMVDSGSGSAPIDPPEDATEISVDDSSDSGSGIFDAFMGFFKSILGFFLNLFGVDSGGGIDELLDAIQAETRSENVASNDQLSLSESDVAALFLETTNSIDDQFHDEITDNSELFEQFA